jgi:ArsR family transcriptional regulator, arsenate/arsenite/antimonite-responsive transcriptional repressor
MQTLKAHDIYVKAYLLCVTLPRMTKQGGHRPPLQTKFDAALFFRALADRTRLRLLNLIGNREVCVCFFVEILGTNQPKISRHLAYLRRAGIVEARRDGKWMHYRLAEPADATAKTFLQGVRDWLERDDAMKKDRMRLDNICCAPKPPAHLRHAPLPARPKLISAPD